MFDKVVTNVIHHEVEALNLIEGKIVLEKNLIKDGAKNTINCGFHKSAQSDAVKCESL